MGIAQYETEKLFNDVASALPTIEEIEDLLTNDNNLDNGVIEDTVATRITADSNIRSKS